MNKKARRLAAVGTAAAMLGAGAAAWAASPASAAPSAVAPRCAPGQLAVWVNADSADGAAGSVYYHLGFTNTGGAACSLYGYPGVSATSASGAQLGDAAVRTSTVPPRSVTIAPGGTAHSILQVVVTDNYPGSRCQPVDAAQLKVYPPGDTGARQAFFDLSSCSATGVPYLFIERVQPGA